MKEELRNGEVLGLYMECCLYRTGKNGLIVHGGVLRHIRYACSLVGDVQRLSTRAYGWRVSNPERQLGKTGPSAARPRFVRALGSDGGAAAESGEDLPNECTDFALWWGRHGQGS